MTAGKAMLNFTTTQLKTLSSPILHLEGWAKKNTVKKKIKPFRNSITLPKTVSYFA